MHDAPFVGSAEDEWTAAQLSRAYSCALDSSESVDEPLELRPEAIFNRRTWSKAWYYKDSFACFAQNILLEFRTCTGYSQRKPAYV